MRIIVSVKYFIVIWNNHSWLMRENNWDNSSKSHSNNTLLIIKVSICWESPKSLKFGRLIYLVPFIISTLPLSVYHCVLILCYRLKYWISNNALCKQKFWFGQSNFDLGNLKIRYSYLFLYIVISFIYSSFILLILSKIRYSSFPILIFNLQGSLRSLF